jgi:hypothetical protein
MVLNLGVTIDLLRTSPALGRACCHFTWRQKFYFCCSAGFSAGFGGLPWVCWGLAGGLAGFFSLVDKLTFVIAMAPVATKQDGMRSISSKPFSCFVAASQHNHKKT